MKFKDFYSSKINQDILENLDEDYKKNMQFLIEKLNQELWTEKQKKRQKNSILPNIALYKTFLQHGVSKEDAIQLVRYRAYYRAEKMHNILAKFFNIPNFSSFFRFFMKKGMNNTEIWTSKILTDNKEKYEINIYKCLWADTCNFFDCPELCEVFCLSDHIVFGNIEKMDFKRNQTLGMKGDKCDFCFLFKK